MSTERKNRLSEIMSLAWQFVRKNGYTLSEALKKAWLNIKLKAAMRQKIVKFYYQKVDGSIREAFGTLKESFCLRPKERRRKRIARCSPTSIASVRAGDRSNVRISYPFAGQRILRI